jgi:hypothetical protein
MRDADAMDSSTKWIVVVAFFLQAVIAVILHRYG